MNLNEINFSFGGLHCLRDFGCIYVENKGHVITPKIRRNEYDISGTPGTILMPGDLEANKRAANEANGIEVEEPVYQELLKLGKPYGLSL